jgi:hypothetical protein
VGSPEKRQRWEAEHRQWAHAYADAQVNREAEQRRRTHCDDEPLSDSDFLRLLKEMPTDETADDCKPFLERLAML